MRRSDRLGTDSSSPTGLKPEQFLCVASGKIAVIEKTGPNHTDRGKSGVKRSLLTEGHGLPIGLMIEGANRHDMKLLRPTIESIIVEREDAKRRAAARDVPGQRV